MFGVYIRRRLALLGSVLALVAAGLQFATPSAGADRPTTYTVRPGDTLWDIAAERVDGDPRAAVAAIRRENGLEDATLRVGRRLVLPSGL